MEKIEKFGLSLSGGGYRAAAFHLGVLRFLHKANLLDDIDVLSTISGGSIIGAYYTLNKDNFFDFESNFTTLLKNNLIIKVLLQWRVLFPLVVILGLFGGGVYLCIAGLLNVFEYFGALSVSILIALLFQFRLLPFSAIVEQIYSQLFFKDSKLNDLPEKPLLAINATNLDTGTLFTFSKTKMEDSTYKYRVNPPKHYFDNQNFPLSMAVACSTCVPYPFNPIKIGKEYFVNPNDARFIKPLLVDGGVYDNQGIHKITQKNSTYKCDIIICSDASAPMQRKYYGANPISVLKRMNTVMMDRIKKMQFFQNIYDDYGTSVKEIAYFSIDWEYDRCISGFADALIENRIREGVKQMHAIPESILNLTSTDKKQKIVSFIKDKLDYYKIITRGLNKNEILLIKKISTSLKNLNDKEIELLSRHAEVLAEIQTKLYCPSLMIK